MRKVIRRRIRVDDEAVRLALDVDAVIAANVGTGRRRTQVSSRTSARVVQHSPKADPSDDAEHRGSDGAT